MDRRTFITAAVLGGGVSLLPELCAKTSDTVPALNVDPTPAAPPTLTLAAKPPLTLVVAPNGNDRWSGKLTSPNASKTDGPFASLERARNAIRELKRSQGGTLKQPVQVLIRGGTYLLKSPLQFLPEDSGTAAAPITYKAYQTEIPTLSGGERLTQWQPVTIQGKQLWKTRVPAAGKGTRFFRQLWVNGQARPRSRYPQKGYLNVEALPDVKPGTPWNQGQKTLQYRSGDLQPWSTLDRAEFIVMSRWQESRMPVLNLDPKRRVVTFSRLSSIGWEPASTGTSGASIYYIENVLEALDQPGEWYLDYKQGELYYFPRSGERPDTINAIIPRLPKLLELQGDSKTGKVVEHLTFEGLTFAYSEFSHPPDAQNSGFSGAYQGSSEIKGAIYAQAARSCSWKKCTVAHVGSAGFELDDRCENNTILNCQIFDLGAGGILVRNGTRNTQIKGCHLYNGGRIFHSGIAIMVLNSPGNQISGNHIHDFYYSGISVGLTWGYDKSPTQNNVIEGNHIHHLGRLADGTGPLLNDKGAIYTLGVQPGTVIRNNLIHDIQAFNFGGWGIYLDAGSSQIVVVNNLVYRTRDGGFHQHYGRDNIIRNNIFALNENTQVQLSLAEPHQSFVFERNIIYWQKGQLFGGDGWIKGNYTNYKSQNNLYWQGSKQSPQVGTLTWQQWQAKGQDKGSIIANPGFVDPGKGNFSLRSNSPAAKIGFSPLKQR
jgi:parallel beta-helix repeat protein